MSGPTISRATLQRQVALAQVQHVGAGRAGDVGAVVDREQGAVPAGRVGEDLAGRQLVARLQRAEPLLAGRTLVAQLDDVDAAGQGGVGELGQVTALAAGVGAQVQPALRRDGESRSGAHRDVSALAWNRVATRESRVTSGAESGRQSQPVRLDLPLPSHLIRVMPAKGAEGCTDSGLAVIGGGVIGLSVARRAAQAGWSVRVHRTGEHGASWVAGGMLAPHSEGWPGEERLLRLGLESLRLWREGGFLDGLPPEVITARESLVVAVDRADVADLRTVADWLSGAGTPGGVGVGRARRRTPAGARHPARISGAHRAGGGQPRGARRAVAGLRAPRRRLGGTGR